MKINSPNTRSDANRRNSRFSTGPRSEAGKARSSQNAVRSGWFTRDLRVAEGKEELYLEFEQAWRDELQPEGLLELEAFTDFLRAAWHKREVIEAQNLFTASSPAAFLNDDRDGDEGRSRKLDRLHRYERDFERRQRQALRELRRLQTDRAAAAAAAEAAATAQKRTQPPAWSLAQDFLESLREIEARRRASTPNPVADPPVPAPEPDGPSHAGPDSR